jgi:hypothetical protein
VAQGPQGREIEMDDERSRCSWCLGVSDAYQAYHD